MAKVTFKSELNIKPSRQEFPKLNKLTQDEKVRIQLVDTEDITMEYVHSSNIPLIEDGRGELNDKGEFKTKFKGNPISFGDQSILEDKGIDVKNCPISAMAKEHPEWVSAPKRRYAMHIIQYRTKPGSTELLTPFSVEHKVWVFTDKTFLKLREFINEWGDLRKHDIAITCSNSKFQTYELSVMPKAAWVSGDKADTKLALDTFNAGKAAYPDLTEATGTKKELHYVKADLAEIKAAWETVSGKNAAEPSERAEPEAMTSFLSSPTVADEAPPTVDVPDAIPETEETNFDDLLAGVGN